jgi:hypothetical protein
VPGFKGGPDADVEVGRVVLTGVPRVGVPRAGVPDTGVLRVGVPRAGVASNRPGVGLSNEVSVISSVSDASGLSVGFIGSVPRKIYLNGVSVSTTTTEARDAFRRPINKIMSIPKIENPPTRIGRRSSRSKGGWLSIINQFLL